MTVRPFETLRRFGAVLAATSLGLICTPAAALSDKEAATVVQLIETLQEELGDFAYDDEVAADWYEQDADRNGLIKAAGFTEQQWTKALGETYRGFLANLPEAEIRAKLAQARREVQQAPLAAQQKAELLKAADQEEQRILKWRSEGQPFARAVRPFVDRMRVLTESLQDQDQDED